VIELTEPVPAASASDLTAADEALARLGHTIPPSYRAFLAVHDGGTPVRDVFHFEQDDQAQSSLVQRFLGVAPTDALTGNLVGNARLLGERVPAGVLPIADDPFGNLVCIDARGGRDGPVLFWDHEYEGDPPDEANLYALAPDLQTFLDGLTERPPPPEPAPRSGLRRWFGR
jgi:hypothetical protein